MQIDEVSMPRRRLPWRTLAVVAGVIALWCGGAYLVARQAPLDRAEQNQRIDALARLGEQVAAEMPAAPLDGLAPLEEACRGKLPEGPDNTLLFFYAGVPVAMLDGLGTAASDVPARELAGVGDGRLVWSRTVPASLDAGEVWWSMVRRPPWRWRAYAEAIARREPPTDGVTHLAVVLLREGGPPVMTGPLRFRGGVARAQVRVVDRAGAMKCEGVVRTELTQITMPAEGGGTMIATTAFVLKYRAAPIAALCRFDGGETACRAARIEASLF